MSQRFTAIYHFDPGERYAASAFDRQIGRNVSINLGGGDQTPATLVKAAVAVDGRSVALTFEVDDLPEQTAARLSRAMSMGFNLPDEYGDGPFRIDESHLRVREEEAG